MKRWILMIAGMLVVSGTAMADCGTCGADAKDEKQKAACEMKGAGDKAACTMKSAEDKVTCTMKNAEDKATCDMKKMACGPDCKKPCCAAKAESGKKWWKFGFGK